MEGGIKSPPFENLCFTAILLIELYAVREMPNTVATSPMQLLNPCSVASTTEDLNFKCYFILINLIAKSSLTNNT